MEQDDDARVLLGLLLDEPRHWSVAELAVHLGWDHVRVEDVAAELCRDGLAHRHAEFVFASRAASRCRQLSL